MGFYFLYSFIFFFILIYVERKNINLNLKWFFILPFCFFIAFRDEKVPDTDAYKEFYNLTETFTFDDFANSSFEIGFQILTKYLKIISFNNFQIYLGLIALINLLIVHIALKKIKKYNDIEMQNNERILYNIFYSPNRVLSVLPLTLYIAYYGIYFNAIVLRVGISLSLLILITSIIIKEKKKLLDYLFVIILFIISYSIHSSTLIGLPLILILNSKIKFEKKTYLLMWLTIGGIYFSNIFVRLGGVVFSFFNSLNELTILATKLDSYDGNVLFISNEISYKFLFYWIMALFLILNNIQSKIYYKFLNIYFIGLLIFAIFRSILLIERVTDFYLLFSFISFYLCLLFQNSYKFWFVYVFIIITQLVFVLRITK